MAAISVERNKRLTPDQREKLGKSLEKDYGKGSSLAELAETYATSAGRVRLILLERGVTLRSRGGDTRSKKKKA